MQGFLLVNKPLKWTSMDVIRRLRTVTGIKKIGHTGTLDPLATGLLLVAIGRDATREIESLVGLEKSYVTTINLSAFSSTGDGEGDLERVDVENIPTLEKIHEIIEDNFIGEVEQTPPDFSAVKVNGIPAYKHARKGKKVDLKPKKIFIYNIDVLDYEYPSLKLKIISSKGTYIRSLGSDIGKKLGTGGYVSKLERTSIGEYKLENAVELEGITKEDVEENIFKISFSFFDLDELMSSGDVSEDDL